MKFLSFLKGSAPCLGLVVGQDRVLDLDVALAGQFGAGLDLPALIAKGDAGLAAVRAAHSDALAGKPAAPLLALAALKLTSPIPRPAKNVFCVGRNYMEHIKEGARATGTAVQTTELPTFFTKPPTSVNGPFDDVPLHQDVTNRLDYEVELGVVIGAPGVNIAYEDAFKHVFGYTVVNDITAREVQRLHGGQWFRGKGLDGTCPIGPFVVTADEIADPHKLALHLTVNGEMRQSDTTANMIFNINAIIQTLSKGMTLESGDIIATGTPSGVGFAMEPPQALKDGDVVRAEVEGVGAIENRIRRF
jgi:2-keto-4-pentenoate hydratase/2-oxohepta-3-ene-1,7-dioic acid hydratase in catechol pathway